VLAWEHAHPAVKAQIHELRGVYRNRLKCYELSLRLPLMVADAIILEQHLGPSHAIEFIRAVDPWCYPGEKTQAAVVLKSCVHRLLDKSRDAVKSLSLFSEESKSAFLLSPILIKERPALIRKPYAERGYSAPEAPPALAAPVDEGVLPASLVLPPSEPLTACLVQPPAPPPVAPALPHAAPTPAAPMPPPSPGQCFDVDACVRVVANTTPGIAPVHATGLLFGTVVKYEGRGEYLVKGTHLEDAYEMHGIGCAGHTDNLITEDSHKQTEAKVVTANMVDDRASRVIQRFFFYGYRRRINFLKIPCICPAGQGPPIPATMELKALNFGHHGPMYWGRVHPKVRLLILKGYVGNKPAFHAGSCRGDWQGKHLLPAGRHLNGGELPAVGDVLWKVSKLLATDGLHHAYHLNEHRTFNIFAKAHHMKTCRLLSVKGSRQNLTVQQATRVLRNLPVYLQYLHETRIESVPNKLVEGVWDGLRDHYVLAALRARSVVDVAFTTPLIFFTHSDYVSKHQG